MHCPICGTLGASDATMCTQCGTKLDDIVNAYASERTQYAGFWWRGIALLIDSSICFLLAAILSFLLIYADLVPRLSQTLLTVVFGVVALFYYSWLESSPRQGSIGKIATNMRVTTLDGARLSPLQAFQRNVLKLVSGAPFGLGFLLAALTVKKQAFHDSLAKTVVVKN